MARTTSEQVAKVLEVDADIDLTVFIDSANELVSEVCVDSGYTDVRLELIERWLAAHFYSQREHLVSHEQVGPVQQSYQLKVGLFLQNTPYGQHALMLDTAGNLAALSKQMEQGNKKFTPEITHLGESPEEWDGPYYHW